jgi:hypothetical protein
MGARTFPNETKSADDAARAEILQRRPELRGKSLEAMRRILRREAREPRTAQHKEKASAETGAQGVKECI